MLMKNTTQPNNSCQTYAVIPGDSLWKIAKKLTGNGSAYQEIIDQNKDNYPSLETSHTLSTGWELHLNCDTSQPQPASQNNQEPTTQTEPVSAKGYAVNVKVTDTKQKRD